MEEYTDMKSPLTGGKVKEVSDMEVKEFRKEKYRVHVRYYICEDTGEQFTTTAQDTLQFNDLYAQYRVRHGIPFPDEIKAIRERYGLKYSQISKILGFGVNQYAKYEAGEVPSESNGKMIATIKNKDVLLRLLDNCKTTFCASEYEKIYTSIVLSDVKEDDRSPLHRIIYPEESRSIYTGYGDQSLAKLNEMIRYIVKRHEEVFPTKLNKLMFYADFYNFRQTGQSISGLRYCALQFGPVPEHYATIYDNVPELGKKLLMAHGVVGTLLSCRTDMDEEHLSESEKASIDYISHLLRPFDVGQIIEISHREPGWRKNVSDHGYIPYDEAFNLQLPTLSLTP